MDLATAEERQMTAAVRPLTGRPDLVRFGPTHTRAPDADVESVRPLATCLAEQPRAAVAATMRLAAARRSSGDPASVLAAARPGK